MGNLDENKLANSEIATMLYYTDFQITRGLFLTWAYPLVDPAGQQTHIVGISLVSDW